MGGMDMAGMEMAPGMSMVPRPAPEAGMPSMGQSVGYGGMAMPMWFQASTSTYLWFKEWKTDDRGK